MCGLGGRGRGVGRGLKGLLFVQLLGREELWLWLWLWMCWRNCGGSG